MRIESGVTTRYIYFVAVDSTDYVTRETGLSSFTVYRSRNGGAAAAMTTPTINEVDATNMPGVYELLLDEDMTIAAGNDTEEMVFHITQASMAPVTRTIELYRSKITAGNTLSVESDGDLTEVNTLTGHTAQTGDNYARLGAPAGASVSADIATVDGNVDSVLVDTNSLNDTKIPDTISLANINSEVDTALSDIGLDHLLAAAVTGTDVTDNSIVAYLVSSGATADWDTFVNTTDALQAIRDHVGDGTNLTEAGGDGDHLTEAGGTGDQLSAIPWNAAWDTEVQSEATDALNAYDPPTYDELLAFVQLLARSDAAINTDRSTELSAINTNEGSGAGDYDNQVDSVEANADNIGSPAGASVSADIAENQTDLDTIITDTNELQGDWTDGGRLDVIIDAIKTETDKIDAAHAEPTGVPAVNETPLNKIAYLFMALRNQVDVTSTKKTYYDDGGTGEWEKDLSDDGTTYSESEANAI